jgi:hypothetical protein
LKKYYALFFGMEGVGFTQVGASRTTKIGTWISMQFTRMFSSGFDPEVPGLDGAVPEIEGVVPGFTS